MTGKPPNDHRVHKQMIYFRKKKKKPVALPGLASEIMAPVAREEIQTGPAYQ